MQDRKTAFLNASTDKRTISPDRLEYDVAMGELFDFLDELDHQLGDVPFCSAIARR